MPKPKVTTIIAPKRMNNTLRINPPYARLPAGQAVRLLADLAYYYYIQ